MTKHSKTHSTTAFRPGCSPAEAGAGIAKGFGGPVLRLACLGILGMLLGAIGLQAAAEPTVKALVDRNRIVAIDRHRLHAVAGSDDDGGRYLTGATAVGPPVSVRLRCQALGISQGGHSS